jgi:mono/diheme cytochrome c family protein
VFKNSILPVLQTHCLNCHSTKEQKGDLDLEASDIYKEPHIWENVLDQMQLGEMPPKKEKQLSTAEKKQLTDWVRGTLDQIALANAGDPGPVVLRRLSNMEYTYTLHDLTGIESLDPAKEFPVDGAAGEGFTNAGAALVMSPALLTKYLDAAKDIASHAVFTPHGMRWSASTSAQDWTDEALAAIRAIYARHTGTAAGTQTEAQGIKLDTGTGGGRLPLAKYLDALQGRGSADGLSTKYLQILREALTSTKQSALLDSLRAKFREKKLTATDIEPWQQVLWRFANVGHIGKENGPKAWQEPVAPLVPQHEMRVKLTSDRDVTLYLTTTDAGDGSADDDVIWENPRLVAPGRPDLPISGLPALVKHLEAQRTKIIASTEKCLDAIASGKDGADPALMTAWREYLGYGTTKLEPLLTKQLKSTPDYTFIQGWQGDQALGVLANSSDTTVRTPGVMKAHSIATHPSPTRASVIAWRCEKPGMFRIQGDVTDAHPECGNGVTWALEVRRGHTSEVLASGATKGATVLPMGPFENVRIEADQVVALVIGPRDGSHVCDLTAINLTLHDGQKTWDLAKDVSPNILKGNPHGAWHFLSQPATLEAAPDVPAPIAEWRKKPSVELAVKVRQYLEKDFPLNSPLLRPFLSDRSDSSDKSDLSAKAPSVIEVTIPAALANGAEFVVTGKLASKTSGSVQMQVLTEKQPATTSLVAGKSETGLKQGQWSDNNLVTQHSAPILVNDGSEARERFETAFDYFRALFPIALCYNRIVPVDEVVTLTLFYREDEALKRLMLTEAESRELDHLWDELLFVSEAPLKQVDAFEQLYQFATQDAKPSAFEPMRDPIMKAAAAFKVQQKATDAVQRQAVIDFAAKAWRRPLNEKEMTALKAFPPRLMLVRVLTSPAFLYRGEKAPDKTGPVSQQELATRLSYFLWSSTPDDELRTAKEVATQLPRMLRSDKVRRLATEFGCQWLHVRDVATLDEKSERHFPTFLDLRDDMQEEVTRFFIDLIQNNRSVLSLLDADHTFVNEALSKHYGFDSKGEWKRIDGLHAQGRGGILGFAATLSKQAGASRNSAILRGTWLTEVVLGEKLPIPPKGVPILPEEAPADLTERQLIERHSRDENCMGCHKRIDPFGFALEGFDAIGRARKADTKTTLPDGTAVDGLADLRDYLLTKRRDDFLRQFCRKLLGYALGRSVQLSDKPLIDSMLKSDLRIGTLVEMIVRSPQFCEVRGRHFSASH